MYVSVVLQGLVRMSAAAVFWSPSEAKTLCLTAGCIWAITTMCVTTVIAIFTCVYFEYNSRQVEYYALNFLCSFSETFPRFQLHYSKQSPHWVLGLCYYKVSLYFTCYVTVVWVFLFSTVIFFPPLCSAQSFPPGSLRCSSLHERDGGLRRAHLHDPPHQSHLPHPAGGLQKDHSRQKGRDQLLHFTDDQRLHEESCATQPPPNSSGKVSCLWILF